MSYQHTLTGKKTSPAGPPQAGTPCGPRLPEQSTVELGLAGALFVATVLLLSLQRDFVSMNPDEGIVLQGAARILHGEVPYRDFFSFYTPMSYYLLALAFKIFGESLLVGRTILVLYVGLFSALTYLLARRIASRRAALITAYLVLAVCPFRFLVLHNWDSTVWALLAFYCAVRSLESPSMWWPFGTGLFTSLTLLTEQSKGAGLTVGLSFAVFLIARKRQNGALRRQCLATVIAFALPLAVVLSYFASQHALSPAFDAWLWPVRHYSAANATPLGFSVPLSDAREMLRSAAGSWLSTGITGVFIAALIAIPALPLIAVLSALLGLRQSGESGIWNSGHRLLAASTTTALLVSVFATRRPDMSHLIYLAPICFFLLPGSAQWNTSAAAADSGCTRAGVLGKALTAIGAVLLLVVSIFGLAVQWNGLVARAVVHTPRGTVRMLTRDKALEYIQAHVPVGHKLFVHPYSPLYTFLSGTYNPTRFEYLQAGMHTPQQFQEATRELSRDPSVPVLLEVNFGSKLTSIWPATPASAAAADPIADFILSHYRPCAVLNSSAFGSAFIYLRRSELGCAQ
jgi:4-amino-4-deoxy-L-arabinose transferase-like glycosyltransferase